MSHGIAAQGFVNGDFESGTFGWTGCTNEIDASVTYGGVGSDKVAEVDADLTTDPIDDRLLCQSIPGFTIGEIYRLEFEATRREHNSTPEIVSVELSMDNDALHRTVTRSGAYAMVTEGFVFTATSTTHIFKVLPNFEGPFGMVFDNFAITSITVLPIEVMSFTGTAEADGVHLNWLTATEQESSHFTVQRSTDGLDFHDVVEVAAAGSTQEVHNYGVIDPSPISGLAYYRLELTDVEGEASYFTTLPVHFERSQQQGLSVFPNPSADGRIWLVANGLMKNVVLPVSFTDMEGCLVHREYMTLAPGIAVDVNQHANLGKGTYIVSIPYAGKMQSIRVVLQ